MILSVIIVSYNVRFFLEQCLSSLKKAVVGSSLCSNQTEIFVVDNASSDGSLEFLVPLFPDIHFIQNKENKGFAKANNQVVSQCSGDFILFLNPDTILAEDCLDACLGFFHSTPAAGAVGLRMIDGCGMFLKESKRGFPSTTASFYKMSGLTRLFPRSKKFAAYYMGHLEEGSRHPVDILSGAFMMVRKTVIEKTGGFDEQFFMYGEDIDLSWRIHQSGYLNYYLPDATVIHFKGESTPKDHRYVKMFYAAMMLFLKKHFKSHLSFFQLFLINGSIRFHQSLTYMLLSFNKPAVKKNAHPNVFIKGDPGIQKKLKSSLSENGMRVTENENEAEEIIYCEGPFFSWKSAIAELSKTNGRIRYKFHGNGTHAAVGSSSSREQGEAFEL
jgi:N-acetylglucosaminyl-diphospho-decaprenol L-rhamnosyltransferase